MRALIIFAMLFVAWSDPAMAQRGRGGGGWHGGYRGGGGGFAGGIVGGVIGGMIGGAMSRPQYQQPPQPYYQDPVEYCVQRYRSYNPNSGYFFGYDGQYHRCP